MKKKEKNILKLDKLSMGEFWDALKGIPSRDPPFA